jgi:NADH-quinone oxidoreductase subunit J
MLALPLSVLGAASSAAPLTILALCIAAGIGTVLLLPSRKEASIRKIGGALLLVVLLLGIALLVRQAAQSTLWGGMGLYFWIFSVLAIIGAIRVVTHPRPVYSALYFVLTVMASAGLFILMYAEFMAAALVIIYAGAILITYVFVIMLAAQAGPSDKPLAGLAEYDVVSREPVLACAVGFTLMGVLLFLIFDQGQRIVAVPTPPPANVIAASEGPTQQLGRYLFTNQLVNLELAGLILTMSMVGAIIIARRRVVDAVVVESDEEVVIAAATPVDDNPHSIPVTGTDNPRQKAYPET